MNITPFAALESKVREFCDAAGIDTTDLLWRGPEIGAALRVLMRRDVLREAEQLERVAAGMRQRAELLEGAARQLRALDAHHRKEGA